MLSRLYLKHKRRSDENFCPLCFAPIKWIYDGFDWIPCDREPILVYSDSGEKSAVIKKKLCRNVALYADGAIEGKKPVSAHRPHVCTCENLGHLIK